MAHCPHCQNEEFRLAEQQLIGASLTYAIVSCANCDAPVGVLEQGNLNSALEQQESAIDALGERVSSIEAKIDRVLRELSVVREHQRLG